ncbi:KN motif and ankyrin repeat domain-containing protein 3 isoform X2 [Rhea pennata]|uniref:KN motif and ankyrin repeat domain-containing protein 3 isoform X2 n=1 Tax=Rhea pennata TaxID=8795 RepID=UPI002E26D9D4
MLNPPGKPAHGGSGAAPSRAGSRGRQGWRGAGARGPSRRGVPRRGLRADGAHRPAPGRFRRRRRSGTPLSLQVEGPPVGGVGVPGQKMAQPAHLNQNLPDLGGPFLYRDQDDGEKSSYSVETPYGFLLDLDFLKYVDDIESGQTLKKVPLPRRAKAARQQPGALRSPSSQASGWTSTESLTSTTSEEGRTTVLLSPRARAPLETREPPSKQVSHPVSPTPALRLLPPPARKCLVQNPRVEKTLLETSRRLEQEQGHLLESGNVIEPGPPSPSQGSSSAGPGGAPVAPSQPPAWVPSGGNGEGQAALSPSLTGSTRMSPSTSGHSTPATGLSAAQLQHVREQMAAALRQLRELEEQVKTIPILEMKICELKQEKEKLLEKLSVEPSELESDAEPAKARVSKIAELRKLTEKLSVSERNGKGSRAAGRPCRSVAVGEDRDMSDAVFYYRSQRPGCSAPAGGERERRDVAVWVLESSLGLPTEAERELELLQHTVGHQKEVIALMEGHLREATRELEELRLEVCARRPRALADKEVTAKPQVAEALVEAAVPTRSQAAGDPVEMADRGVSCSPPTASVGVGCRLEGKDAAVGRAEKGVQADGGAAEPDRGAADAGGGRRHPEERGATEPEPGRKEGAGPGIPAAPETGHEDAAAGDGGAPPSPAAGALKSIMKKRDGATGRSEAEGSKKSLQFVGVLNGEYESTSSEEEEDEEEEDEGDSSSEKLSADSSGSDAQDDADTSDEGGESDAGSPEQGDGDGASVPEPAEVKEKFELSPRMREACLIVKSHLGHPGAAKSKEALASSSLVLQEWFRVSSQKSSVPDTVANHLLAFAEVSPALLAHVVNLADGNGNTALHYSVSHSNFHIVRLLLDTGVCNVDHQNKAGYTALMLAALAAVEQEEDMNVVRRLFSMGNVNAKASQAGQTALMLAVSHGRQEMVEALLACGADVNLQDEEGSTALMCACEHGRVETVKLLLAQPTCNISIVDSDGNNAVAIALEAGHSNIAVLLYAHLNSTKTQPPQGMSPTGTKSPGNPKKPN